MNIIDDQRPTSGSGPIQHTFWKTSNGHNSATRHPIPFMFGCSGVFGDSGSNGVISGCIRPPFCKFTWPSLKRIFGFALCMYFAVGFYHDCWRMW